MVRDNIPTQLHRFKQQSKEQPTNPSRLTHLALTLHSFFSLLVFYLLEGFCALAAVCLFRIMSKEVGPIQTWRICQRQQATRSTAPSERSNSFSHQGIHSHRGKGGDRGEDENRDRDRDEYEYEVDELESGLSDSRSVSRLKDETKPLSPTSRTKADLHERLIRNISTDR